MQEHASIKNIITVLRLSKQLPQVCIQLKIYRKSRDRVAHGEMLRLRTKSAEKLKCRNCKHKAVKFSKGKNIFKLYGWILWRSEAVPPNHEFH